MRLIKVGHKFLIDCGIPVSKTFLNNRIQSHPDAGSLVSFTDTLDELGIKYIVAKVDKFDFSNLSFPFLTRINGIRPQFEIISSLTHLVSISEVQKGKWDGVAVMINPGQNSTNNSTNLSLLASEKSEIRIWKAVLLISFIIISAISSYKFDLISFGFIWLSVLGLSVCSLIVMYKLGSGNSIVKKICNIETSSCGDVIDSKFSTLSKNIDVADVGIVYFTSLLLFSLFLKFVHDINYAILIIPCFLAFIISIVSIYYQWKIIKNWCKLCLLIIGFIWLQLGILYLHFNSIDFQSLLPNYPALLLALATMAISSLWLLLKPMLKLKGQKDNLEIQLSRWKRNPEIFRHLLLKGSYSNTLIANNPFNFGPADSHLNITMVSGITCSPCAKAHEQLDRLYEKYRDKISISIIFAQKEFDIEKDKKAAVIAQLVKQSKTTDSSRVISNWYQNMNVGALTEPSAIQDFEESVLDVLQSYRNWNEDNIVLGTPTFFINGYLVPHIYQIDDLESFIPEICDGFLQMNEIMNE